MAEPLERHGASKIFRMPYMIMEYAYVSTLPTLNSISTHIHNGTNNNKGVDRPRPEWLRLSQV